jgi:hypothetical protein
LGNLCRNAIGWFASWVRSIGIEGNQGAGNMLSDELVIMNYGTKKQKTWGKQLVIQ